MASLLRLPGWQLLRSSGLMVRTLALVVIVMSLLATLMPAGMAASQRPQIICETACTVEEWLTLERCQAMDSDNSGVVENWEEDHFYWDLPDFNNNGDQGDQEDQDTAQAYCSELVAANEPVPPAEPSYQALIAQLVSLLIAILTSLFN